MRRLDIGSFLMVAALNACRAAPDVSDPGRKPVMGLDWGGGSSTGTTTGPTVTLVKSVENDAIRGPLRMAVAADGSVWVTDPSAGVIHEISAAGDYSRSINPVRRPLGIAIDAAGQLVVGDGHEGRVVFVDTTSGDITGAVGAGAGEFSAPQDIAIASDTGDLWILDSDKHTVVVASAAGAMTSSFGARGTVTGAFNFPAGIAIDATAGEVYVSDSNNARVQVFTMAGTYVRKIGSLGSGSGKLVRTQGVALDGAGRMFVADVYQGRVGAYQTTGTFSGWVGGYGDAAGSLQLPSDLLYDSYGRLWVASYGTSRVEVYGIDSYSTPPSALPATAAVEPASFSINGHGANMTLYVDVPSSTATVDTSTVSVDGDIPLDPDRIVGTDVIYDGNTYEAELRFARPSLQDRYGAGTHTISIAGSMDDGAEFEGTFTFTMTDASGADTAEVSE